METMQSTHPSPRQLAALALGRLKPDARDRLQAHVATCASCETFLAQTPPETLKSLLQQSVPPRNTADQPTSSFQREHVTNPAIDMSPQARAPSAGEPSRGLPPPADGDDSIPRELRQQTKYRIVRLLGRGGMGSVYEVHHERMDRRQALKVINPELVDNPQALSRFEEEIKAVAKLDHPNIARAYDAESFGPLQAIVMEFVAGQTLHEFLKKRGRLSVMEACRCVRQACLGLQHAHERGIVHRDLKPQNLMLTQDTGIIKILDFGLAKVVSENKAARGLTKTNMTMGTYEYTAPEQALDAARADIRADIYSLGCTLYYLIAGVLPFACNSDVQLLLAHQNETPRPLCEVCPETPRELSDLVDRMLAKNPADRPQTPGEVATALLPFAKGEIPAGQIKAPAESLAKVRPNALPSGPKAKQPVSPRPLAGKGQGVRARRAGVLTRALAAIPPRFRTRGWFVAAGGAAFAGVVLLGMLIMMRTPDGTLIVEVSDPDATVQVLNAQGKVLIERKAGSEKVEISVVPSKGKLCVNEKGFELFSKEFSLASGGREIIRAKLVPLTVSPLLAAAIEIAEGKTTLAATADGRRVLVYRKASPTALKPYIQELYTPGGVQVLRDSVADHPHHHGMMFAVAANGVNFWEEQAATGRETCEGQMDVRPFDATKSRAGFSGRVIWTKPDGAVVLNELREINVYASAEIKPTLLTWRTRLETAPGKTVLLTGERYCGLGMRLVESMDKCGRFFFNSDRTEGVFVHNSERVTPAKWCAFSSQVNGRPVTIAIFDCPKNHPAARFFTMRPFAYIGATINLWKEPLDVTSDRPLELSYGVAVWDGDIPADDVETTYHQWIKAEEAAGTSVVAQSPTPLRADDDKSSASNRAEASHREVDLLKLVDPAKDAVRGKWSFADGSLVCEPPPEALIEIPYDPPEEYDYRIVLVPTHDNEGVEQICRGGGRQFRFIVGGWRNTTAGFRLVNGKYVSRNATTTKASHWITAGQRNDLVVKVRNDGVEGWCDNKRVVAYKTDWTNMRLPSCSNLHRPDSIGIEASTGVRVESAKIIEITGEGRCLRVPPAADESSLPWRDLFDGKTLDGWDGDPRLWSVQDGAITGETTGENTAAANTFLTWRGGRPADFEIKAEFRMPNPGFANSGIQIRSWEGPGRWQVSGYQADMDSDDQYTGTCYGENFRGSLAQRGQKTVIGSDHQPKVVEQFGDSLELAKVIKTRDWNEYDIIAHGNHIIEKINGQLMCELIDDDAMARRDGVIALQIHAGQPMKVQFRNVRLKEFPSAESAAPAQFNRLTDAETAAGWKLLFDGESTRGWHLSDLQAPSCWTAENGQLVCAWRPGGVNLASDAEFQDFDLHLDFCLDHGANSGVFLRGLYEVQVFDHTSGRWNADQQYGAIFGQIAPSKDAFLGPGTWNSLDVRLVGRKVNVTMNGERVIEDGLITKPTAEHDPNITEQQPGPIVLQCWRPQAKVRFRNVRIRPIEPPAKPIGEKPATSNQGASTHQALSLPRLVFGEWLPLFAPSDEQFGWDKLGNHIRYCDRILETRNARSIGYPVITKDVSIRAKAKKVSGQNIRLALRQSDSGGYSAWFSGGRRFGIGKVVGGKYVTLIMGDSSESCDDFFDFDFSAMGDTLTLSVNGQPLLITHDSSHSAGTVSVGGLGSGLFKDVAMFIPTRESLVADNRKPPAEPMSEESPAGDQAATSHGNVDLLKLADPTKDVIIGKWSLKEDVIIGKWLFADGSLMLTEWGRMMLPSSVEGNYDLEVEFTRTEGDGAIFVILPVGSTACDLVVNGWQNKVSGLEFVDFRRAATNDTKMAPAPIVNGQKHLLACRVRTDRGVAQIEVDFDGRRYFHWSGKQSLLFPAIGVPDPRRIGLGAVASTVFHAARLRLVASNPGDVSGVASRSGGGEVVVPPIPNVAIVKATYGWDGGEHRRDVTKLLQWSLERDPFAPMQDDGRLMGDPLVGYQKQFVLTYRHDAEEKTVHQRGEPATIPVIPPDGLSVPGASGPFRIIAARLGGGLVWKDITTTVRRLISDPGQSFDTHACQDSLDPWPTAVDGWPRWVPISVVIWFDYQGKRFVRVFPRGKGKCVLLPRDGE